MKQKRMVGTVQEAVYEELKKGIMTLKLEPGCEISTQEIAKKLNVSRTPVREAFIRLQREGLVESIPQRGTVVSRIDLKRVEQESFIRECLELAVVKPFLEKCTPEHFAMLHQFLEEQRQFCREKNFAEFVHSDNHMHKLFFTVAGQELAWDTISNVTGHYYRIRILTVQNEKTIQGTLRQHEEIVRLMEEGRSKDAREEMSVHVKKLNYEKMELVQQNADYFVSGEEPTGLQIGSL